MNYIKYVNSARNQLMFGYALRVPFVVDQISDIISFSHNESFH